MRLCGILAVAAFESLVCSAKLSGNLLADTAVNGIYELISKPETDPALRAAAVRPPTALCICPARRSRTSSSTRPRAEVGGRRSGLERCLARVSGRSLPGSFRRAKGPDFTHVLNDDGITLDGRRDLPSYLLRVRGGEDQDARLALGFTYGRANDSRHRHPRIRVFLLHLLDSFLGHMTGFLKVDGTVLHAAGYTANCTENANSHRDA